MPSKAKFYTARLNPINPEEKKAMAIIKRYADNGVNFKQLTLDRILRGEGIDPVIFQGKEHPSATSIAESVIGGMESLFSTFAQQIIEHLHSAGATLPSEAVTKGGEVSPFARNLAKGYLQRQQQAQGEIDEDDE